MYWLTGTLAATAALASYLAIRAKLRERKSKQEADAALAAAREAAENAAARAAASDLAKTRFLAVASHDMRQPLHALSLYLSALERRVDNDEARSILAKMERATESMIAMFASLLDLARIEAGALNPEISEFSLQEVFDRLADPGGAVEVEPTTLTVRSDAALLERALCNLLANALAHGGGRARLTARAIGERAEIVVADDGPGIAPEDRARVFEEFVRIEARGEGLGLGLPIVRGIARALDVPLDLESEPGHGARFILRPLLAHRAQSGAGEQPPQRLDGIAVLIVDDDQLAREANARALGDIGAVVHTVPSAAEAESALDAGFQPRLLLMDLRIDGELGGIDLARKLCARIAPPPHVVIVTGDTAADTLSLMQASGFAWLIKPASPEQLTHTAAAQVRPAQNPGT